MDQNDEPTKTGTWRERLGAQFVETRDKLRKYFANPKFEPAAVAQWATTAVQTKGLDFYFNLAGVVMCTYFVADLTALLAGRLIPDAPIAPAGGMGVFSSTDTRKRAKTLQDYDRIMARNLFNSEGIIPGEESQGSSTQDLSGPPIRTTLPFNLVGTMILRDELRSIATLEDKSAGQVYPVRVQDEIPGKIRVLTIEARKVIFVNITTGRREFVDLPEDTGLSPRINLGTRSGGSASSGIEQTNETTFNVARGEVDKALADLNNILTQARAVPNFENGMPAGYKLFQIVPGSIYEKLGLRNGDTILGFNGDTVNDPGKAFEALSNLKTTNHLQLQIKRDGKVSNYSYDIR